MKTLIVVLDGLTHCLVVLVAEMDTLDASRLLDEAGGEGLLLSEGNLLVVFV